MSLPRFFITFCNRLTNLITITRWKQENASLVDMWKFGKFNLEKRIDQRPTPDLKEKAEEPKSIGRDVDKQPKSFEKDADKKPKSFEEDADKEVATLAAESNDQAPHID